ncbi:hypothetical protein DSL72_009463 [Monilinia vaccinii-corymbosi]|uniref:Uncharacterized protein n=1 Tax=Monilinia vaccinii-corymbosi TaxID=61207 RepID=A0A8A3PR69_9HELO|nr:hypothetical protein DSL72_009463 [Monilinia vaccinii-corymbosi]
MESSSEPPSDLISQKHAFRFPTPTVDTRISTWVETQSTNKMSTLSEVPSDESHLSESTYEFVDTDTESHDENATDSIASVEYGRPDDMASLADTENSDESGDEHTHSSSIPGYGLDNPIENPFNDPTIDRNSAILHDDSDTPLSQSIEFEEPFGSLGTENVSVKHTVAEFTKEQTEASVRDMNIQNPPSQLILTIRQTMTKQGLSTKDPLRILYVGSHSAKQDIIHKIASSVAASVEGQERPGRSSSQIYNVVPVSAFGSEQTPEVELMHSSGYQIKVDDCLSAQILKFEDFPEKPDIIKLNLEDPCSYHSVPEEDRSGREGYKFSLEPEWELPHVAIFYCSDSDDVQARRTRTIARKFMNRHNIPSIVISHKRLLNRAQCMSLEQHSIHMCLESRETRNIIHQRLPIDLTSFLNIDARQMNRNLAYLTGLHEPSTSPTVSKKLENLSMDSTYREKPLRMEWIHYLLEWRSLIAFGLIALSFSATLLASVFTQSLSHQPSISINSKAMSPIPMAITSNTESVPLASISPATEATFASTQTISPSAVNPPSPNSLSKPQLDFEKLAQAAQKIPNSDKNCDACTAEILGDREVLIRIPSALRLNWLTKLAMSVNITRDNITVDAERAYSLADGIVLLLPKKEAYGVLNISVVTTKKPRIIETFQVDFGTNPLQTMQDLLDKFYTFFKEDTIIVDGKTLADVRATAEKVLKDVQQSSQSKLANMDEVKRLALERASSITTQLTNSARSMSLEAAKRSARISHELGSQIAGMEKIIADRLQTLQNIGNPLDGGILKAQVRSKSLWLKMQGKKAEAEEYERRASIAISKKTDAARKSEGKLVKETKIQGWKAKKDQDRVAEKREKAAKVEARQAAKVAKKEAMAAAKRAGWASN